MKKGYTLVELLIYISLVGSSLLIFVNFISVITSSGNKSSAISEVQQSAIQLNQEIHNIISNADSITSPVPGASSGTIEVIYSDPAQNPSIISLSTGIVEVSENGNVIQISSDKVIISNLQFQNNSGAAGVNLINYSYTSNFNNPDGRQDFFYEQNFYGSARIK